MAVPRKVLAPAVLGYWVDELERALFPFQESEFEQESFTDEGRQRASLVLQRLVKALADEQGRKDE